MIVTPDLPTLPCSIRNGIKYFELIAEPVKEQNHPTGE